MILEKMDDFFNNRIDGYEEHQLNAIASAKEFYPFTAEHLPMDAEARVLDLGCGTGLELGYYFDLNPTARVTGIDMAEKLLETLKNKYAEKNLTVIRGSYFDVPFGQSCYDAVVSVESLHHFTKEEKIPLYTKIFQALRPDGCFLLTDYFSLSEDEETFFRQELLRLKAEQGISDSEFYHYDTPLTVDHEIQALRAAGFSQIEILGQWGPTHTIQAKKSNCPNGES